MALPCLVCLKMGQRKLFNGPDPQPRQEQGTSCKQLRQKSCCLQLAACLLHPLKASGCSCFRLGRLHICNKAGPVQLVTASCPLTCWCCGWPTLAQFCTAGNMMSQACTASMQDPQELTFYSAAKEEAGCTDEVRLRQRHLNAMHCG